MFLHTETGQVDFPNGVLVRCVRTIAPEGDDMYPVGTVLQVCDDFLINPEDKDGKTYGGIFANWELFEVNQPLEELL